MSSLDELESKMLSDARGFLEPDPADEHRVFSQLSACLVMGGAQRASRIESAEVGSAARLGRFAARGKAFVLSCTLLGAAAGFGAGYYAGRHSSAVGHASGSVVPSGVTEYAKAVVDALPTATPALPHATASVPAVSSAHRLNRLAEATAHPRSPAATIEPGASSLPGEDAVAEEVALLKRVDRAIRSRDSQLALSLLGALDERFPKGKLLDERAAAKVMAECQQLEPAAARRAGESYLRKAPSHVYHERVRQLCGLVEAAPDGKATATEKASVSSGD